MEINYRDVFCRTDGSRVRWCTAQRYRCVLPLRGHDPAGPALGDRRYLALFLDFCDNGVQRAQQLGPGFAAVTFHPILYDQAERIDVDFDHL